MNRLIGSRSGIESEEERESRIKELREPGEQKIAQLRDAAERGDAEAKYQIACEYIRPLPLLPTRDAYWSITRGRYIQPSNRAVFNIDREEGIKWFYKAAEQGHVEAQYQLGMAYTASFRYLDDGTMVPMDNEEGIKWLHKAAEQGHVDAHYALGFSYLRKEDKTEAIKWFRQAASMGHEGASDHLRRMEE